MASGNYSLQVLRGLTTNRSLLSCTAAGYVDLFDHDDDSGRQQWKLERIPGLEGNIFNIIVSGGTDEGKTYLSARADGTLVDLYYEDDGTGHQRWVLDEVETDPQIPSYYTLTPVAGVPTDKKYLSVQPDGTVVDLWTDDGSGHQYWQLQGPPID